jgi:DNA-binding transcriptional LysR family regulator
LDFVTLRQLEILRSVLVRGTLSGAADALRLTQPAVSMQMKALASEIGVPLFEPRGRRLEPTAAGRILAAYAERILHLVADAATAARLESLEAAVVRVAASSTPGVNLIPDRVAAYRKKRPKTVVRFEVLNSEVVESRVATGEVDFGVVGGHRTQASLVAERWCDDELVLVVPPNHRLARRRRVNAVELSGETLLARESGSATRATIESAFLSIGAPMPSTQVIGDTEAIKRSVAAGLGVGIVSRFAVQAEVRAGLLALIRLTGLELGRPLQLVWDPGRELSPPALEFLEFLKETRFTTRRASRAPRRSAHSG